MATAGEVARAALADLNAEAAGILNALRWTNERYTQTCSRRMRHRKADGELIIPAAITAGTVTVTQGSTAVTGNATALAAWSARVIGRFFQIDQSWYALQEFIPGGGLRLVSPYSEASQAGASYKIVQRYAPLAADVAFLGAIKHDRRNLELQAGTKRELDAVEPRRLYRTGGPQYVADVGEVDGLTQLEVYPYSTQAELLRYDYWTLPPLYDEDDDLPSVITVKDLKEGVLIDCMRWWAAKAASESKSDMAGYWRNEYRAQESRWEKVMQDIYRRDRSPEQMHLMIRDPNRRGMAGTIRTAYDEVWSRY